MSIAYQQAIDILVSPEFDPREIAIEIAKQYPDILVAVAAPPWVKEVDELARAGRKIDAIKLWRHMTGASLKDAKDAVDLRAEVLEL